MKNNFYIRSVMPDSDQKGVNVSYAFNYPLTGNSENGNIYLTNDEYLKAISQGTVDDMTKGVVEVLQTKIVAQNTVSGDTNG